MYETAKLRGRIVECYGSQRAFCRDANKSVSFVSQYMCGKKFLDQRDIDKWIRLLKIPDEEIPAYFFTTKVHESEN